MAHSYVSIFIHYIFSTKNREMTISPEIQDRLWAYMGGVARENKMKALALVTSKIMLMYCFRYPQHSLFHAVFNSLKAFLPHGQAKLFLILRILTGRLVMVVLASASRILKIRLNISITKKNITVTKHFRKNIWHF